MIRHSELLSLAVLCSLPGVAAAQNHQRRQPVTVPAGTAITVRLNHALNSESDHAGTQFSGTLAEPISVNGGVVLPRGTQCYGTVVKSQESGHLKGKAEMELRLDSLVAHDRTYPVVTVGSSLRGKRKRAHNLKWIGGGAAGGSVIGAIVGGGTGALIGAGVGAVGGTAGAAATSNRSLKLPAETPLTFTLAQPLTM